MTMKAKLIKKLKSQGFSFRKKDIPCLEYDFEAKSSDAKITVYFLGEEKISYEKVYNYLFNPTNKEKI